MTTKGLQHADFSFTKSFQSGRFMNYFRKVSILVAICLSCIVLQVLVSADHLEATGIPSDTWTKEPGIRRDLVPEGPAKAWAAQRAEQLFASWETEYAEQGLYTKTPIHLGFSRAFSEHFTKARGKAEMNFRTGQVTVSVDGLDPLSAGSTYEVWLVDNVPGLHNTAAIDLGVDGDRILNLGALPATGSLVTSVAADKLASLDVDMAAVMRVAPDRKPEFVIGGMQSIRFQIGREARINRQKSARSSLAAGLGPTIAAAGSNKPISLVAQGEKLFFNGTFGGNGRTCGTCHRANNNLTIDIDFINTLPPSDPLFVAEFDPNLPGFNPVNPNQPAMEDGGLSGLMRTRGLILENIEGFALDGTGNLVNPPFFRAPPSLFNLQFTAPYGLSDCCPNLQIFATDAVIQHFTKTLNRAPGLDFVLPTAAELKALEAFMLSNASPLNGNFKISGTNSLLSIPKKDPKATDTTRPEVRGRDLFLTVGCAACHLGTVFSGGSVNLNTGVEVLEHDVTHTNPTPTVDTGDGLGQFQIPQLFGLRKNQFFHTGLLGNKTIAIPGQSLRFTNLRDAVSFYVTPAFAGSPGGLAFPGNLAGMSQADIDDIAHFLEAISNP